MFVSYLVAIILFAFCGASALADEADVDSDLYGAWELMKLEMGGMSIQFTLIIDEGEIIASNTCAFKEYRVLAEVSSPAVITSEEIRWIHRSQDHDPAGKLSWQDVAVEQPMR